MFFAKHNISTSQGHLDLSVRTQILQFITGIEMYSARTHGDIEPCHDRSNGGISLRVVLVS